jgi:hypothetical protein
MEESMENTNLIKNRIVISAYFLLILSLAIYNYIKPYYSYDLIPYTASTISIEQSDKELIHKETYKIVKDSLPTDVFMGLVSGEFGQKMYTDFVSFNQSLNFYKIKPLYIYIIFGIHKLGLGIVETINLISVLSFLGISILLYLFISKLKTGHLGIIILSLLMVCQPFILIAGRNTPDALSAFIILLSLFLILNKKSRIMPGILLTLSIAIRPDNLILSSVLLLYFGILAPKHHRFKPFHAIGFLLVSIILYFSISILEHSYGWKTLFTVSFLHFIERPADTTVQISVSDYVKVLFSNGISVLNTHIIYFIVLGLTGLLVPKVQNGNLVFKHLILLTTGVMIVYFLVFPSSEVDRYFITEYLIITILSLRILCDRFIMKDSVQKISSVI